VPHGGVKLLRQAYDATNAVNPRSEQSSSTFAGELIPVGMSTKGWGLPADLIQLYAGVSAGSEDDRPDRVDPRCGQAADQRGEAL